MNEVKEAMGILRKNMEDTSEGELYHAWMCNIKFAVYDVIANKIENCELISDSELLYSCEQGAKLFLDRLLSENE